MYKNFGLLYNNQWCSAENGETQPVFSAASEQQVGTTPSASSSDVETILECAEAGFKSWKDKPAWERSEILHKASELIKARIPEIAQLISSETGKPLAEAQGETRAAAEQFQWYAGEATRLRGELVPSRDLTTQIRVDYEPVGVCLSLSAWNFPALLPARKIAAALAAGCSCIARPASEAPGATFAIAQCLIDAGLPENALTIVTGSATAISSQLIRSGRVNKVSLTGSIPVGKSVAALCAEHVVKVSLELGGHAAVIVHKDADPEQAAIACATAKFRNAGQVCISPSRFFVHEGIADAFTAVFRDFASKLTLGNGLENGVTMGPLIRGKARDTMQQLVVDAVAKGATVEFGGKVPENCERGYFFEPTVLSNVPDNADIMSLEPFGPVAPIVTFTDTDEVIKKANSLPFGLASYIFTNNAALAHYTSRNLQAGMVGINDLLLATAEAPFGGVKESGYGREGGQQGIYDYVNVKYIKHKMEL